MFGISLTVLCVVSAVFGALIGGAVLLNYGRRKGLIATVDYHGSRNRLEHISDALIDGFGNFFSPSSYRSQTAARDGGMAVGAVIGAVVAATVGSIFPIVAYTVFGIVAAGAAVVSSFTLYRLGLKLLAGYLPLLEQVSKLDLRAVIAGMKAGASEDTGVAVSASPVGGPDSGLTNGANALNDAASTGSGVDDAHLASAHDNMTSEGGPAPHAAGTGDNT